MIPADSTCLSPHPCSLSIPLTMLIRCSPSVRRLPIRALKPVTGVNSSGAPPVEPEEESKKTVPFIPREFAKDTIEFFRQSSPHVKSLLDLVFSPVDAKVSEADRIEFEERTAQYNSELHRRRAAYAKHEEKAARVMFEAIRNLPEDLYDEAVRKGAMMPPDALQFHEMYRGQLMRESLSDWELVKLQTFSNLMHIRYSHSEAKKKHRDKFFISESAALNLRKERAKKEKNSAKQ